MPLIGIVSDGKPGHLNQSLGLAQALQRQRDDVTLGVIDALSPAAALRQWLWPGRSWPAAGAARGEIEAPKLLIAAGHATHLSLLALGRRARCPTVVLMRPSLPARCFDLCIQPRHDGGSETSRLWVSDGALNPMQPASARSQDGVILIGGPSPHFSWDEAALMAQLAVICDGSRSWQLSGSRRTPPGFLAALAARHLPGLTINEAAALPGDWLVQTLPAADVCWVTPDSASMVYEALTAGCAVGIFNLPSVSSSRVAAGIAALVERGQVSDVAALERGKPPRAADPPLAEAQRMARRILALGWL